MFRRIALILAVLGAMAAIYVVATAQRPTPAPPPAQPPATNPYPQAIVAIGLVEPRDRPIQVAAPEPGRVVEVLVQVNDHVKRGQPLFRLDGVPIEADLIRARATVDSAQAELQRLEKLPRPEDLPPAIAEVDEAKQRLADAQDRMNSLSKALEEGAASDDETNRQRFLVSVLRQSLVNAEAKLALLKAGTWDKDLDVQRAVLEARRADVRAAELRLDRLTVRAPSDGTVLKRNVEPGEYASPAASTPNSPNAAIIIGDLSELNVRAQVDEEDTPLLRPGAKAIARIRGPFDVRVPLTMLRIEPLARPKTQITGASTELIDTRVVEVIFRADLSGPGAPTLYPGQIVDVFIEASNSNPTTPHK